MNPKQYERKLLKADGSVTDYPPKGKTYTLEQMQAAVGGYIQIVPVGRLHLMVINEEGKLHGLPRNDKATELYNNPNDEIVGDALVCSNQDID